MSIVKSEVGRCELYFHPYNLKTAIDTFKPFARKSTLNTFDKLKTMTTWHVSARIYLKVLQAHIIPQRP